MTAQSEASTPAKATAERLALPRGAWVEHRPGWLEASAAESLYHHLEREVAWQQRSICLFGKMIPQPRLISWAGELPYRYSGQTLEPAPTPDFLRPVWRLVEDASDCQFNHVLMNRYRDGSDSMGWHADDEPELGTNPTVASLSLGASRRFLLRPRRRGDRGESPVREWLLEHASLFVMGGSLQHHFRHAVPRVHGAVGERISLTFRHLHSAPLARRMPAPT